ncbi:MAG TPA: hypothetical protein VLD63_07430 [Anaerolineales bacterium]|nr:hypothetical protein [Anaerolineales bacterium]
MAAVRAEDAPHADNPEARPPAPRVPFQQLVEAGVVRPGQRLYFRGNRKQPARVRADGRVARGRDVGSIHQLARALAGAPCNGWDHWYFADASGDLHRIDELRQSFRKS